MPFRIVRNDITKMNTEAIVNTANEHPTVGTGCDHAVYMAAGYEELLAYRREHIGFVKEGDAFITPGFHLPAKYIIHAVSPLFIDGKHEEEGLLRSCYRKSLALAAENGIRSIAFPLISTGGFGYPKEEGMRIAVDEIHAFLLNSDMQVCLVVFDEKATRMGKNLYPDLEAYIDLNYVRERREEEYGRPWHGASAAREEAYQEEMSSAPAGFREERRRRRHLEKLEDADFRAGGDRPHPPLAAPGKKAGKGLLQSVFQKSESSKARASVSAYDEDMRESGLFHRADAALEEEALREEDTLFEDTLFEEDSLSEKEADQDEEEIVDEDAAFEEMERRLAERIAHMSDTFPQYLLYLIDQKGMENAEVYKRAIVDKKVFSKIKNNPDYHPQKLTALCLCIGAKLNLDESRDLLARAGYALSPCDKTDIIFSYFIEHGIYDMIELDIQLEEHGLPCIIT
ncbi:MAG: macro domain-containing protein [Blautia sp.]|nr:macro domain-containing protein [Blautia sp.]